MLKLSRSRVVTTFQAGGLDYELHRVGKHPERDAPIKALEQGLSKALVLRTLQECGGNVKRAAVTLQIKRTALHARLTRWGVNLEELRND